MEGRARSIREHNLQHTPFASRFELHSNNTGKDKTLNKSGTKVEMQYSQWATGTNKNSKLESNQLNYQRLTCSREYIDSAIYTILIGISENIGPVLMSATILKILKNHSNT